MVLVLFDIDGTLLRSRGVGLRAMEEALTELHGIPVDGNSIKSGGRLDPHIFIEMSEMHDLPVHDEALLAFRDTYVARMAHAFDMDSWSTALPGAREMVKAVHDHPDMTCAMMTGNIEPTSWMKLQDAGFEREWFEFGVYGDEGEIRRDLTTVALERHRDRTGEAFAPAQAVVIGDTEHDIDCAHHSGCQAIAVTTGMTSRETLAAHEPELLLDTLEDTNMVMKWLESRQLRAAATD